MTASHFQPSTGHTPTPWEAQPYDEDEPGVFIVGCPLGGLVGMAGMWPTEMDAKDATRAIANAAFIVEAVNNYESLRAQLASARKALEEIDRHLDNFGYLPNMKARKLARAALKEISK